MSKKYIKINWAKFRKNSDPAFMGNNIVAFSCDDTIVFIDINTGDQKFYRASGDDFGEGISCIAGHKLYHFFAFAELAFKPKIFILSYPQFVTLQVISNEDAYGNYIQMKFSHMEHLIALTGYPHYKLKLWNFRLGHLIVQQETGITSEFQRMKINNVHPFLISQYSPEQGKIIIWEAHASGEKAFLIGRPLNIPDINYDNVISMIFGFDGLKYFVNNFGDLFYITPSAGQVKSLWQWNAPSKCVTVLNYYRGGFVISGYNNEIKYIKKVEGIYTELWSIMAEYKIICLGSNNPDLLCMLDDKSNVSYLKDTSEERTIEKIGDLNRTVKFFDLLYPQGEYVVILSNCDELILVEIETGKTVSAIRDMVKITSMISQRDLPIIITGDSNCVLKFISFYEPVAPNILTEFVIGGSLIKSLKLSTYSNFLVVCDNDLEFYIFRGLKSKIECLGHFRCEYYVFDYTVYETPEIVGLVIIISKDINSKPILSRECLVVNVNRKDSKIKRNIVKLPHTYTSVVPLFTVSSGSLQFIAVSFNDRRFDTLEIKDHTVKLVAAYKTIHQVKSFKMYTDLNNIVTFGLDGIVTVFDVDTKHLEISCYGSNRFAVSCVKACCVPNRRYCLALSKVGSLKCLEVESYITNKIVKSVTKNDELEIEGYIPPEDDPDKSWLMESIENKLFNEIRQFKDIKLKLYGDLSIIKKKVTELLDKNDEAEDLDKLKINQFNLNIEWENNVKELARKEREDEDSLLRSYIADQDRITKWIINNTWDRMEVHTRNVHGMFSSIACENFGLISGKEYRSKFEQFKILRYTATFAGSGNKLLPWMPKWASYYKLSSGKPTYGENEAEPLVEQMSDVDAAEEVSGLQAIHEKYALSGTNTHDFIEPDINRHEQFEVVSFYQMSYEEILGQCDILRLKEFFNKKFEDLVKMKEDQFKYVKERNERLRYIQKELIILANLKGIADIAEPESIDDPTFSVDEMPETIIKVEDDEIVAKPYISPSRQKILNALAYQEEQRRLALLADDFRERALMAMMDGLLERLWEDEIKKNPPLPDCVKNNKDPYEYTKEDVKAVQEWTEKMKILQAEREKYNTMLTEEQSKMQFYQDEQIIKFNTKCGETYLKKVQVDASIRQEELKILRTASYNYDRKVFKEMEKNILAQSQENKLLNEELLQTIQELDKLMQDCRLRYEQLQARDRLLDKQFKYQFGETAPAFLIDQAYKVFKKRPKWPQRAWATAAILTDMANRIIHKNSSTVGLPLPEECYEYLTLVESGENYNLAPNTIDRHMWNIICRMRRYKMESEFRLRACGAQLAEAEASLNAFSRELQTKKNDVGRLDRDLQELRQKYREHLQNRYVHLVLPMGLVEIPLTGQLSDFNGSVLLCSSDVGDINEIIKHAGVKKLQALHRYALFRKKVLFKEWKHKVYQMTLDDMKHFVDHINKVKVTLEMLDWLRRKKAGRVLDLSTAALNHEVELKMNHLQRAIPEMDMKIEEALSKVETQKQLNISLDKKIQNINIDVTQQSLQRDVFLEEKELRERKERMEIILERGKLVRKIQTNHAHILELATVLELQRLRTFPTLAPSKNLCP